MLLNAVRLASSARRPISGALLGLALLVSHWQGLGAQGGDGDYLIDVWTGENGLPNATEVWLRLKLEGNGFKLVVEDNGQGLPGAAAGVENGERLISGHGLHNLEKRLRAVGGRCDVYSAAGQGTRIVMATRNGAAPSPVVVIGENGSNGV